jgi:hypothetical protein
MKMDYKQAIEAIKKNYPPENYSILRQALDLAIELMEQQINDDKTEDFKGRKLTKTNLF